MTSPWQSLSVAQVNPGGLHRQWQTSFSHTEPRVQHDEAQVVPCEQAVPAGRQQMPAYCPAGTQLWYWKQRRPQAPQLSVSERRSRQ